MKNNRSRESIGASSFFDIILKNLTFDCRHRKKKKSLEIKQQLIVFVHRSKIDLKPKPKSSSV